MTIQQMIKQIHDLRGVKVEVWGSFEEGYYVWTDIKIPLPEKGGYLTIDSSCEDLRTLVDVKRFLISNFEI